MPTIAAHISRKGLPPCSFLQIVVLRPPTAHYSHSSICKYLLIALSVLSHCSETFNSNHTNTTIPRFYPQYTASGLGWLSNTQLCGIQKSEKCTSFTICSPATIFSCFTKKSVSHDQHSWRDNSSSSFFTDPWISLQDRSLLRKQLRTHPNRAYTLFFFLHSPSFRAAFPFCPMTSQRPHDACRPPTRPIHCTFYQFPSLSQTTVVNWMDPAFPDNLPITLCVRLRITWLAYLHHPKGQPRRHITRLSADHAWLPILRRHRTNLPKSGIACCAAALI